MSGIVIDYTDAVLTIGDVEIGTGLPLDIVATVYTTRLQTERQITAAELWEQYLINLDLSDFKLNFAETNFVICLYREQIITRLVSWKHLRRAIFEHLKRKAIYLPEKQEYLYQHPTFGPIYLKEK